MKKIKNMQMLTRALKSNGSRNYRKKLPSSEYINITKDISRYISILQKIYEDTRKRISVYEIHMVFWV